MSPHAGARRNLRLYPWYVGGVSFFARMPVFFLYFSTRVSLAEVLVLEAIYYACVVLLEVPSGYFSDRFGRRPTLIIAAAAMATSYAAFALASSFAGLALGRSLLAIGLAFNSGTDTSFHLANLEAVGQPARYARREANLSTLAFATGAVAALAGGAGALIDMRLAYGLSFVGALVALVAAVSFRSVDGERNLMPASLRRTLRRCFATARDRRLGWFFAAVVIATVVNHIPYEFYQPYLERLDAVPWDAESTPLVAGLHLALVQIVAAPVAGISSRLAARLGTARLVLVSMLLQIGIIVSMAWLLSPWVAVVLAGRSVPRALQDAPIRAAVTPHVNHDLRATYLSLQSLTGRLAFSALLISLSAAASDLFTVLQIAALTSAGLLAILVVLSRGLGED